MENEDFFGVEYLSKNSIPQHFLPQHTKEKKNADISDKNFFDNAFFPKINNESKNFNSYSDSTDKRCEEDDFFTENFYKNRKETDLLKNFTSHLNLEDQLVEAEALNYKDGLKALWALIDPVWKYSHADLVDLIASQIIYETDDLIAFNKPYQMAYSGAPKDQAQFDRLLVDLKKQVAPKIDRLHLIKSLDKSCSGIILFAKNKKKKEDLKKLISEGHALYRFRALVKNSLQNPRCRINIALIKVLKDRDYKLCPLNGAADKKHKIYHLTTDCQLVNENKNAHVSLVDAFTKTCFSHVVRSHLYYGANTPILGDRKYIKWENSYKSTINQLPRLSNTATELLNLKNKGDIRKLPLFLHLAEMHVPETKNGKFSIIRAELPNYFVYALKKLKLFKK